MTLLPFSVIGGKHTLDRSIDQLFDIIFSAVIFMMAIGFTVACFSMGSRYNDMLAEELGRKTTTRQDLSYSSNYMYITPEEALSDILAGDEGSVTVNGLLLNSDVVDNARLGDGNSVKAIRNALNARTKYRKQYNYDASGNIVGVCYIGG